MTEAPAANQALREAIITAARAGDDPVPDDHLLVHWMVVSAWAMAGDEERTNHWIEFSGGHLPHYICYGLLDVARRILDEGWDEGER
jgi:hypothetical protein